MVPTVPDLDIEVPELTQVAFVVEDIDDGMGRFGGTLGFGPWEVYLKSGAEAPFSGSNAGSEATE